MLVDMKQINLPLPAELLEAIDQVRGDVPRTVWIRRAIEERLQQKRSKS
jgi:metal-responsive CopG/Arc/MetJ family transcriptional regulator